MLNRRIVDLLNQQINKEFFSSYQYLAMSAHCESIGFSGSASWLKHQAVEENEHGMKIYDYLQKQQEKPSLEALAKPSGDFGTLANVFTEVLRHEQFITGSIQTIASVCLEEKDHATYSLMQWFINEQIEEEDSAKRILDKIKMAEASVPALFALDRELASRS